MIKKYLFPILLTFFSLDTFAQDFEAVDATRWLCTYNYEYFQDSTSKYSLKNDQMYLQIGSHLSKFTCASTFLIDSVLFYSQGKNIDEQTIVNRSVQLVSSVGGGIMSDYIIYKNYPGRGSMVLTAYDDHKYYKVEQPMSMKWKIDMQKDTVILGYTCQRAFISYGGRDWVAWYSPQIPSPDGPYKFNGLPGLILKISDTKNQHCFTLNSIKKVSYNQLITLHTNSFIDITAEDYIKIMKNKMVRLYGKLQSGAVTFSSEEAKAKSLHGLMERNNFIEKL